MIDRATILYALEELRLDYGGNSEGFIHEDTELRAECVRQTFEVILFTGGAYSSSPMLIGEGPTLELAWEDFSNRLAERRTIEAKDVVNSVEDMEEVMSSYDSDFDG